MTKQTKSKIKTKAKANNRPKPKPQAIELPSRRKAHVSGVRSLDGTKYIDLKYGNRTGHVPYAMFVSE